MADKATKDNSKIEDELRFLLFAVATAPDCTIDFGQVAKQYAISRSDHAGTKLQNIIKKYGYKYARGSGIEALDPAAVAAAAAAPRAKATPKKRKKAEAEGDSKGEE